MKKLLLSFTCYCIIAASIISCKKKEDDVELPAVEGKYVVLTATEQWDAGFYTAFSSMPGGSITNITPKSLQVTNVFGVRSFKNWFFDRSDASGAEGLQKYTVSDDGTINNAGFIVGSTQYTIVDENTGFYLDENRGLLKLQKFNPTTMIRTGEIDLSTSITVDSKAEYQVVGKHILAAKEGKLYASITYGTNARQGFGDDLYDGVDFAVIDIATGTYEKTISYAGIKGIGWGSSANTFTTLGDDGALYMYSPGFSAGITNSAIIRIKAGETDFDKTFIIKADDYQQNSTFATALVRNGKLYTQFSNTSLDANFTNLNDYIFDYYEIDLTTKVRTKITGIPTNHYAWANEQAITEIDGQIYFWVQAANFSGYYVLDGGKGKQVFENTDGGFIWGLVKL